MPLPAGMAPSGMNGVPAGQPPPPAATPAASEATSASAAAAEEVDDADAEMAAMAAMGFPTGFASTAGEEVKDARCKAEGISKKEQRKYRQYMNRRGGFNRPLDEV